MFDTIAIHRGRNSKSTAICKAITNIDYNFDYRGFTNGSKLSPFWFYLKAWLTSKEIPEAKNYFIEGGLCFMVGYFLKKRYPDSKLFVMVPEPIFYMDKNRSWLGKFLFNSRMKMMKETVDHFFFISKMVKDDAISFLGNNIRYSYLRHFIINIERFKYIPNKAKNIIYVCERPHDTGYIKGLDIAVKIFEKYNKKYNEAKLYIVGSGTEALKYGNKNILCLGYCNMEEIYKKCSILISPSRYDAFPLVVAESALCGLVPIVSKKTGIKEILEPINKELIIDINDTDKWIEIIEKYMFMREDSRENLYTQMQKEFIKLNQKDIINNFIKEFNLLKKN